jgi:magnesium chelatase subunit D
VSLPTTPDPALACWADALRAAALLAVDPHGLGGALLRAGHGPVREAWLEVLRTSLPEGSPVRRVPLHAGDERLIGGLDLPATLAQGRPVAQAGLLAEADGGVLVLAMAERLGEAAAARLATALDTGEITLARDGLQMRLPARVGVIALDESVEDDESPPVRLRERTAFHLDLSMVGLRELEAIPPAAAPVAQARAQLAAGVTIDEAGITSLVGAALALGAGSPRAEWFALRAARAAAALDGRDTVSPEDLALAARLVLAPRATRLPAAEDTPRQDDEPPQDEAQAEVEPDPPAAPPAPQPPQAETADDPSPPDPGAEPEADPGEPPAVAEAALRDQVLAAARAALPPGLLARLAMDRAAAERGAGAAGRVGALRESRLRGRPLGARPGTPRSGARLALIDTLRAAAPWQLLRRRDVDEASGIAIDSRIRVRPADFRVVRLRQRTETTTIFAVDASGSAALHRLAEAKGAVELLLADCYVRRDRVAVVAFRGRQAEVLLAPTRSLVRARRELAALPGGGGTPLAAGIDAAAELARAARRRGGTPVVVLLTDGRANIARNGTGGRAQADLDARASARQLRAEGVLALLIDTAPQPQPLARELAAEMGAGYLPLPRADARGVSQAVQAATRARRGR